MKDKFTLGFYVKSLFIIIVLTVTYINNAKFINNTLADKQLSFPQTIITIFRQVLAIPNVDNEEIQDELYQSVGQPGNTIPYLLPDMVKTDPAYQHSYEQAQLFNSQIDMEMLNEYFLADVNTLRQSMGWRSIDLANHLSDGVWSRVEELATYHYLSSQMVDGQTFRGHFPYIDSSQYRLGENLYELYIAADDIHLSTWENEEILADYLFDAFSESLSLSNYETYRSQYLAVKVEPTDYQLEQTAYVRLVVSLIMDTGEEI